MRKSKALLASITALSCLCASCLSMAERIPSMDFVIACAEKIATSGTCGENLTWNFEESTGTLTISGTGTMKNWDEYPDWHDFDDDIKKIILKNGVTTIGSNAFSYCTALTSITIPDSVTAIGGHAFYGSSLTSIIIPDSVTTIGDSAFLGTPWLKTKQNENPLVIINGILIDGTTCEGKIRIPDSVTTIGSHAFSYCTALESIIIPDSVKSIESSAFSDCPALESITIPDSVTTIGDGAFACCSALTSV
ncbi:MAG: leucine-rich repeat domain-containing protein, partial [Oscillospiraceae bacterium]|nr:leucine-rich repeat domain-containing protein [Oscillospiraceae bacterium]